MSERSTVTGRRSRFFNYLIKRSDGRPMLKEDRTVILDLLWDEKARKACLMYAFEIWDSDREYAVSIMNSIADAETSTTPAELLSGLRKRPQGPATKPTADGKGEGEKAPQRPELSAAARELFESLLTVAKRVRYARRDPALLSDALEGLYTGIDKCERAKEERERGAVEIRKESALGVSPDDKKKRGWLNCTCGIRDPNELCMVHDEAEHSPETEALARKVGVSPQAVEDAADAAIEPCKSCIETLDSNWEPNAESDS